MKRQIKSYYLTYNERVATPTFDCGDGVAEKVIALRNAFRDLGIEMEIRCIVELVEDEKEQEK